MSECHRYLTEAEAEKLQAAIDETPFGGVLCLKKGKYPGNLIIRKSLTIKGLDGAKETQLSAGNRGSVVIVTGDEIVVRLEGLTFKDGNSPDMGGGLLLDSLATVTVIDSIFENNRARHHGGGAVYARRGEIVIERCRFSGNSAGTKVPIPPNGNLVNVHRDGGAIFADGASKVSLKDCLIVNNRAKKGSAILAKDGAILDIFRCTIADNQGEPVVVISSTLTRSPVVKISESIITGEIIASQSAQIEVENSVFEKAIEGGEIKGTFKIADPEFSRGEVPYMPKKTSPCAKAGSGGGVDLYGTKRPEKGSTIGAIEIREP